MARPANHDEYLDAAFLRLRCSSRALALTVLTVLLALTAGGCAGPQASGPPPGPSTVADPGSLPAMEAAKDDVEVTVEAKSTRDAPRAGRGQAPRAWPGKAPRERSVIKVGTLEIISSAPQEGFDKAIAMARGMGGFALNTSHAEGRATVTLRVPADRFEEAVRRLTKLGKVGRRDVTGSDVTAELFDLRLRLRNAERIRVRYLSLLQRASTVAETLEVEKELERVTLQIEQLRGRIALMQSQVDLSTIHLTLREPTRPGPVGWIFYGLFRGIAWLFVWN